MIPFPKTVTVTPQTVTNFGDRTPGTGATVPGCAMWETPGVETPGAQDTVVYDATLLAPPGTVVNTTDRVTVDGFTYEVTGQPIAWQSMFTGHQPGVEIHLRRVDG